MTTKSITTWGVRELARAAGISPTTASRVKRGTGPFDSHVIAAVATATGTCIACGHQSTPSPRLAIHNPAAIAIALRQIVNRGTLAPDGIPVLTAAIAVIEDANRRADKAEDEADALAKVGAK